MQPTIIADFDHNPDLNRLEGRVPGFGAVAITRRPTAERGADPSPDFDVRDAQGEIIGFGWSRRAGADPFVSLVIGHKTPKPLFGLLAAAPDFGAFYAGASRQAQDEAATLRSGRIVLLNPDADDGVPDFIAEQCPSAQVGDPLTRAPLAINPFNWAVDWNGWNIAAEMRPLCPVTDEVMGTIAIADLLDPVAAAPLAKATSTANNARLH